MPNSSVNVGMDSRAIELFVLHSNFFLLRKSQVLRERNTIIAVSVLHIS